MNHGPLQPYIGPATASGARRPPPQRSYAHWLEEAGTFPTRRRPYMGHVAKAAQEDYLEHDVTPHLAPDAALPLGYSRIRAAENGAGRMTWLRKLLAPLVSSDPVAEHRRLVELTERRLASPEISPECAPPASWPT